MDLPDPETEGPDGVPEKPVLPSHIASLTGEAFYCAYVAYQYKKRRYHMELKQSLAMMYTVFNRCVSPELQSMVLDKENLREKLRKLQVKSQPRSKCR